MALRICVCVKLVPRAAVQLEIDRQTKTLVRSGATALNPADEHAVEAALQLHEEHGAEVVVVALAPIEAIETLRTALAMGADRAILVADVAMKGADLLPTSRALAKVLERESPDLVLFGSMSSDGAGALLWAAVAERLRMPLVSRVGSIVLKDRRLRVSRQTENGVHTAEVRLGCVVALSGPVNVPRYPTFKSIIAAKRQSVVVLTAADIGLQPQECGIQGSGTTVLKVSLPRPPAQASSRILDGPEAANQLFTILGENGLL